MMRRLRSLVAFLLLILGSMAARAGTPMPDYLRDLDRPYNAGDWTLQCNGSRLCQIIGVAKIPGNFVGVRAVVMIERGIVVGAQPSLRLAFIDAQGTLSVPAPNENWRLYSRGLPKMPPPFLLSLEQPDPDGAYRVSPLIAAKVISALKRWPGSVINDRGRLAVTMPRGNLARLFRKMDKLQHPKKPRLSPAEKAEWLKEYHYTVLRASEEDRAVPEAVLLSCDTRTYVNQPQGRRIGATHVVWTADCPEGTKVFLQRDGEEPVKFDVRDNTGRIRPHSYAGINGESLLEVVSPQQGDDGCGHRLKLGFTGSAFVMIEDRRYDRCRAVPYEFWPVVWQPTSWRYAGEPPSNGGNAPPTSEGVIAP